MHYFSTLFDKVLYVFRTVPLSFIRSISTLYTQQQVFVMLVLARRIPIACIHCWDTPDDGQWNCPKHV